jgi:hypothetical protein
VHDGLTALHPVCDQIAACENLEDTGDCLACFRALQIESAACEAFGAVCL